MNVSILFFFFSSRRRHTRYWRDWSSDVCSSDLVCDISPFEPCHAAARSETGLVIILFDARQHGGDRQGVAMAESRAHGCARIDPRFPVLRSWQKPRFFARGAQPAETKLMSDKRAGARLVDRRSTRRVPSREGQAHKARQATFSNELEGCVIALAGANPQNA